MAGSLVSGPTPVFGGRPNNISKGDSLFLGRTRVRMYISTRGRAFVHGKRVSLGSFVFVFLSLLHSGWYTQYLCRSSIFHTHGIEAESADMTFPDAETE